MTQYPPTSSDPDYPPPNQGRRRSRRWWAVGGLVVVLLLVGVAAVYASSRFAQDPESSAADPSPADTPSAEPSLPDFLQPPSERPPEPGWVFCWEVLDITNAFVDVDLDYVETARDVADQLRQLDAPTPTHQAALDELIDEYEAAAQMVEDDPAAELEAIERHRAAEFAFVDAGGCDSAIGSG